MCARYSRTLLIRSSGFIFFQESLDGTQLEWFYQLDGSRINTWEDLATSFYHQYQYNTDLAPTRVQIQALRRRLKVVEIQVVPGLDFDDLGLISRVAIPHKFKVPIFAKYDGISCPKLHLKSYVRKIQPHTTDKKLWVHFFPRELGWNAT